MDKNINRWGHITNVSMENLGAIDYVGGNRTMGYSTLEMTVVAPAKPEIVNAVMNWARSRNPVFPTWAEEWMCLYCGSPQPLPKTHCGKCGAPRNWILG